MDKGAHFYRCDFQVHTPRDLRWAGLDAITEEERLTFARRFVQACRNRGLQAVAITDHHCLAFLPFIRTAANEELAADGSPLDQREKLVVFPGMELTLGVPCQAIVIFDADFPNDMFSLAMTALAITQNDASQSKVRNVVRLGTVTTFSELKFKLDEHEYLRGRYIIFPNVTDEGPHSLLRVGPTSIPRCLAWAATSTASLRLCGRGPRSSSPARTGRGATNGLPAFRPPTAAATITQRLACRRPGLKGRCRLRKPCGRPASHRSSRVSHDTPHVPETYIAGVSVSVSGPALAETLFCSTSFQGYRVCDDGHSYLSTEWQWQGMTVGQDSDDNRWSTSRWRGIDTTTVEPPDR